MNSLDFKCQCVLGIYYPGKYMRSIRTKMSLAVNQKIIRLGVLSPLNNNLRPFEFIKIMVVYFAIFGFTTKESCKNY